MSHYIQLPPDGVGKKVRHVDRSDITITNEGADKPLINSVLYGSVSGTHAVLTGVKRTDDEIMYYFDMHDGGSFQVGDILWSGAAGTGTQYATVIAVEPNVFMPQININDPNTPAHVLKIDKRGAALTTFPEGTPQFDAFGKMQVSQMQAVGEYSFVTEDLPGKFYTYTNGAGANVSIDYEKSCCIFTTGTASGEEAFRITNQYHPYKPGTSQLVMMTVTCGDTGKANVVREWGFMDKSNGMGFRLNGTTLEVFQRSDTSGSVVEEVVPQDDWSVNNLLNATVSDFELDVSKGNIYWFDYEWLGMGRVRMGVVTPDGRRITCHQFENANAKTHAYMKTGTLPVMWRQYNSGAAASISQFSATCAVVFSETADLLYQGELMHIMPPHPVVIASAEKYQPFLSFKAKSKVNGVQNRIVGIHETFDWCSEGDSNISVGIFVLPNQKWLVGVNWSDTFQQQTMLYVDLDANKMPQLKFWDTKVTGMSGSIAGNILTVTSITSGLLMDDMYIHKSPLYPNGPLSLDGNTISWASSTGTLDEHTHVSKQLTCSASPVVTLTLGTQIGGTGTAPSNKVIVTDSVGVVPGQLFAGANIPVGTVVEKVVGNTIYLNNYFSATATGSYTVYTKGGPGTYLLDDTINDGVSFTGYGAYYRLTPIESFIAPKNSSGRVNLGDRMEKSFGLGGNPDVLEDEKPVFVFAARNINETSTNSTLFYTKYWKEIR